MSLGPRSRLAWLAVAFVAVVAILTAAGLFVFQSLRSVPSDVVRGGLEVAGRARQVAAAFKRGTVETTFINYASNLSGSTFLQVAGLQQMEVYTRTEEGSVLWGQIPLPDVVVAATVPVEYTYYVDLDEPWTFELDHGQLWVRAPELRFNTPALDISKLHFEIRESSLLRDEVAVVDSLRAGLTELSRDRARDHLDLIRETARSETRSFVRTWLANTFSDANRYSVEVVFADEEGERAIPRPRD